MKFDEIEKYINLNLFNAKQYEKEIADKAINFINKIRKAIYNNYQITICGDYDVDGMTSSLMLEEMINDYAKSKKLKPNIDIYIPSREEGYGISTELFLSLQKKGGFVFTLDNGTHRNFLNNIKKEEQEKIFIIDHHPNGDTSAMSFVLNPNKDGKLIISTTYLLDYVYQILIQVDKEFGKNADRYKYADLVAMSLVSDMADLNNLRVRGLIQKGLEKINKKERMLYRHLFPKKNSIVTYNSIAFEINPRINSIGRLSSSPKDAITIMKYKEPSNRASKAIQYLNAVNELRKNTLNDSVELALAEIKKNIIEKDNIVFYYNKDIPLGLNGLIAQKIYEIYDIPALVASNSKTSDKIKGSGRGFNIKYILNMFQDNDIFTYGGHNEALGFEIKDMDFFLKIVNRINTKNISLEKEFKNIIMANKYDLVEYLELTKEFTKKTNTIPFKQKFYVELENVNIAIKKIFKNNFCYLELKDSNSDLKIKYLSKYNTAKEIIENKEKFYIAVYVEFNPKKALKDFSGDIILDKNIKKNIQIEEDLDVQYYR